MPVDDLTMHGHNAIVAVTTFYSEALARVSAEAAELRKALHTSEARRTIAEENLKRMAPAPRDG